MEKYLVHIDDSSTRFLEAIAQSSHRNWMKTDKNMAFPLGLWPVRPHHRECGLSLKNRQAHRARNARNRRDEK
jgi:hypothetical protein